MAAGDWEFRWVEPSGLAHYLPSVDERKISFKLNQPGTCELKVPLRSDAGRQIATGGGWAYILAYKGGTLRMVLETVSTDVGPASTEGVPSVAIVGTESAYMRAAGIIPSPNTPLTFPPASGQIAGHFLGLIAANSGPWGIGWEFPGTTPVVEPSVMDTGIDLLSLLQAFAFRTSGFDFRFTPHFEALGLGQQIVGNFQAASIIGVARPGCVFEFGHGTKANLSGYSWKRLGGEHLTNSVYVPANGGTGAVASSGDLTSRLTYGLRQKWVTADFNDAALRTSLAAEHVLYRKQPRRVLSITPNSDMGLGNVPVPLEDYGIGDTVPCIIKDDGVTLISGSVRVYGMNFTIDKDGKESVEIETSQETAA